MKKIILILMLVGSLFANGSRQCDIFLHTSQKWENSASRAKYIRNARNPLLRTITYSNLASLNFMKYQHCMKYSVIDVNQKQITENIDSK